MESTSPTHSSQPQTLTSLNRKKATNAEILDANGNKVPNPNLNIWIDKDGFLNSWLLGIITEEMLGMSLGAESAYQVWRSLEEKLLLIAKEKEVHLTDRPFVFEKGISFS